MIVNFIIIFTGFFAIAKDAAAARPGQRRMLRSSAWGGAAAIHLVIVVLVRLHY
jgi:hypothetical protein